MRDHDFWELATGESLVGRGSERFDRHLKIVEIGRHICFGGKGGGGSSSPDPQVGQAALMQAKTGDDWLQFAREQFAEGNVRQADIDALSKRVTESQLGTQDLATEWAKEAQRKGNEQYAWALDLRKNAYNDGKEYEKRFNEQSDKQYKYADEQQQRYKDTFQPIEDKMAADAMSWDSDGRLAEQAAQAKSDVMNNAAAADQQRSRQMAAMGVDPRSGRYDAADRASGLQTSLAAAGAQNAARDNVRQQAVSLRGQAAGIGQAVAANAQQANTMGMQAATQAQQSDINGQSMAMQWTNIGNAAAGVGNSTAAAGLGLQAGSSAMGTTTAANQNWLANNQQMANGFSGAMQGYAGQANTLSQQRAQNIQAQGNANSASAAGMQAVGTLGAAGMMAFAF